MVFRPLAVAFPSRLQFGGCAAKRERRETILICGKDTNVDKKKTKKKHQIAAEDLTKTVLPGLKSVLCGKQGLWETDEDFGSESLN